MIATHNKKETIDGVNILPLPESSSRMERMFKKKKLAYELAVSLDADIYHFHDPELIPVGIKLKRKGKKSYMMLMRMCLIKSWTKDG